MTKTICITLEEDLIKYVDDLADINGRNRSNMIAWIIAKEKQSDEDLEDAAEHGGYSSM